MAARDFKGMSYGERAAMLDAARGLTARQSAEKRGCTLNTMYDRQRKVKARLNAKSITHAVALTIAYGYITREEIMEDVQG